MVFAVMWEHALHGIIDAQESELWFSCRHGTVANQVNKSLNSVLSLVLKGLYSVENSVQKFITRRKVIRKSIHPLPIKNPIHPYFNWSDENHRGSFCFVFSIPGEQFEWKDRVGPNIVVPFATRQAANDGAAGTCVTDRAGDVGSDAGVVPTVREFVTEVAWSGITAHGRCVTERVGYGITSTRLSQIMSLLQVHYPLLVEKWRAGVTNYVLLLDSK